MQVKVRKPHRSNYPNPIKFQRGERVCIGQADTKYGGWIWTTVGSGNSGWAPLQLLELEGDEAVTQTPWGSIRAGDMLAAWVAHDLLHTRQLVELRWAYTTSAVLPFRVNYAGDW